MLFVAIALEYGAYFAAVLPRPTADERWDGALPGGNFANVLGQSGGWQWTYGIGIILALYVAKTGVVFGCKDTKIAAATFALLLLACLPILWVFLTTDWNNAHAELAYWFTLPVGLLTVPTVGMIIDLDKRPYARARTYVLKTLAELALLPVVFFFWILIELMLGFYWI